MSVLANKINASRIWEMPHLFAQPPAGSLLSTGSSGQVALSQTSTFDKERLDSSLMLLMRPLKIPLYIPSREFLCQRGRFD